MNAAVVAGGTGSGGVVPGWDRIGPAALVHTAQAVASEALRAPIRQVRARVADDGHGSLAVEITAPSSCPHSDPAPSRQNRCCGPHTAPAARSPSGCTRSPGGRSTAWT